MNIRNLFLFYPVYSGLNILILLALFSFPLPSLALTGPYLTIPDVNMIFRGDVGNLVCNYFYLSGGYVYCPAGTVANGTATISYIPGSDGRASTYIYSGLVNMWKADESDYVEWERLTEGGYCVSGDKISFTNGQFSSSVGDGTTAVLHATSFSATIQGTEVNFPSEGSSKVTSTDLSYNYNSDTNTYYYTVKYGMCEYSVSDSSGNIYFSDAVFNLDSGYLANMGPDYQRSDVVDYINGKVRLYESEYYFKYLADDSSDDSSSDDSSSDDSDSSDDTSSGDSGTTEGDSGTTEGDSGTTDEDSGSSGGSSSGGSSSGGSSSGGSSSGGSSFGGSSSGGGSSGGGSFGGGSGDSGTTEGDSGDSGITDGDSGDSGITGGDPGDSGITGGDSGDSGSVLPPDDSGGSAVVTPDDPVTDPPDSSEGSSGSSSSGGSSSGDSSDSGSSGDSAGSGSSSGSGSASGSGSDSSTSGGSGDSGQDGDGILAWLKKIYNAVVSLPSSFFPTEEQVNAAVQDFDNSVNSDSDDSSDVNKAVSSAESQYFGSDSDGDGFADGYLDYIPGKGSEVRDSDNWFYLDFDKLFNVTDGSSVPLQFTFSFYIPGIGDINLVIDTTSFSSAYDTYIRPVIEFALYMFTLIRVISVVRRTLFMGTYSI